MQPVNEGDNILPNQIPGKKHILSRRHVYLIIIVAAFVILAYILINPLFVNLEGQSAPDFSITDVDGNEFTLSKNEGKVVVLDFMALYCSVCIEEMEHLRAIFSRYSQDDITIATISIDGRDSDEELATLRIQHGGNWTFARDTDGVSNKYKVGVIPTIVIIDKEGIIRFWEAGEISASRLSSEINKWL